MSIELPAAHWVLAADHGASARGFPLSDGGRLWIFCRGQDARSSPAGPATPGIADQVM
jgi:hypothetical protein